ncbi:hypothetical protein BDA96_07G064100 [Sorghum bicolor]|uniref:Uncharacterized protein n=1 Tax=Sorghum bicolor TaxID=4558 RepID=A0A921U9N2_SORBI|nr:hypothetical protein BDA96_07G064100 [Sorghum bicolor]
MQGREREIKKGLNKCSSSHALLHPKRGVTYASSPTNSSGSPSFFSPPRYMTMIIKF